MPRWDMVVSSGLTSDHAPCDASQNLYPIGRMYDDMVILRLAGHTLAVVWTGYFIRVTRFRVEYKMSSPARTR
jgi:hypothetical protein